MVADPHGPLLLALSPHTYLLLCFEPARTLGEV